MGHGGQLGHCRIQDAARKASAAGRRTSQSTPPANGLCAQRLRGVAGPLSSAMRWARPRWASFRPPSKQWRQRVPMMDPIASSSVGEP
eukprot:8232922-Pyramimonas_sp.AAC.1